MTKQETLIVRAEIAERIEEAAETLKRMPDGERELLFRSERGQKWPAMLHTAAEHAAWKPGRVRRPPPTGKQIDRMNEVLDWLLMLARQDRGFFKAVWLICAARRKQAEAAKIMAVHRTTAQAWCDSGLDRIAAMMVPASVAQKRLRETLGDALSDAVTVRRARY